MIREKKHLGATFFYDTSRAIFGLTELPAHFAAVNGCRVLIVGEPGPEVIDRVQLHLAHLGFKRAHLLRVPAGQGPGLLVDLVA